MYNLYSTLILFNIFGLAFSLLVNNYIFWESQYVVVSAEPIISCNTIFIFGTGKKVKDFDVTSFQCYPLVGFDDLRKKHCFSPSPGSFVSSTSIGKQVLASSLGGVNESAMLKSLQYPASI